MKKILILIILLKSFTIISLPQNDFKNNLSNNICIKNKCTDNVFCTVYTNQNMCKLYDEIPKELKNLPYVVYPTDIYNYNVVRWNYNKRFNIFPHAIIVPENSSQVEYTLSVLKKYKLDFAIRSGGHCYGPGSLSSSYVFDLSNFNQIIPDIYRQEVYIGAGCVLGEVIQRIGALNFAIPTGTCPSVGVTGLALGGGLGFLSRAYGLTCDSIKSILMVNAESKLIEVTPTNKYADLFWAMTGAGGGSYGIVLGFKFKMYPIKNCSFIKLDFKWETNEIIQVMNAWQNWVLKLSTTITTEIDFRYKDGHPELSILALKSNSEPFDEWKSVFSKFSPKVEITTGSYVDCAKKFASVYTRPFSKARSKFIFQPINLKAAEIIVNFINQLSIENAQYLFFISFGSAGGKISSSTSSYFPKQAFAWIFMFLYWNYEYQNIAALKSINTIYNDLEKYCSKYSYSNLVDYELGNTYLDAYYGNNVNYLVNIKNKYDPQNIFKWRQSIPLAV